MRRRKSDAAYPVLWGVVGRRRRGGTTRPVLGCIVVFVFVVVVQGVITLPGEERLFVNVVS